MKVNNLNFHLVAIKSNAVNRNTNFGRSNLHRASFFLWLINAVRLATQTIDDTALQYFFFWKAQSFSFLKMFGWICLSIIALEQIFVQGDGVEFSWWNSSENQNSTPPPCTNICSKTITDRHIHPYIFESLMIELSKKKINKILQCSISNTGP